MFLHEFGEPFSKNRLSDMIKKHLRAAGVDKPGAAHLFRHAMATHMLTNGADIRFIQAIFGPCAALDHRDLHPRHDREAQRGARAHASRRAAVQAPCAHAVRSGHRNITPRHYAQSACGRLSAADVPHNGR